MLRILKIILFLFLPLIAVGQLKPLSSQYLINPLSVNPAYAGSSGALSASIFYRSQWVGFDGAPETASFTFDTPLRQEKIGLGVFISNDKIGATSTGHFMFNYSYKAEFEKGTLFMGLGAGLLNTSVRWNDLVVLDPGDIYFQVDQRTSFLPQFSIGAYYTSDKFFVGLSVPEFLSHSFNTAKDRYQVKNDIRQYNFLLNTGYSFEINPRITLHPSIMMRYNPGNKVKVDINAHIKLYDLVWIGASYRSKKSIVGMFQLMANKQLKIAYLYEIDMGDLGKYSSGTHEIMLKYAFRYTVEVIGPRNF